MDVQPSAGTEAVGVRFRPGRAGSVLRFDTADLRDRQVRLDDVLGSRAQRDTGRRHRRGRARSVTRSGARVVRTDVDGQGSGAGPGERPGRATARPRRHHIGRRAGHGHRAQRAPAAPALPPGVRLRPGDTAADPPVAAVHPARSAPGGAAEPRRPRGAGRLRRPAAPGPGLPVDRAHDTHRTGRLGRSPSVSRSGSSGRVRRRAGRRAGWRR